MHPLCSRLQVIGHGHIMVNGRVTRMSGLLLKPHDIVEPSPKAVPLFKRLIRTRLNTNTFVFRDENTDPRSNQCGS